MSQLHVLRNKRLILYLSQQKLKPGLSGVGFVPHMSLELLKVSPCYKKVSPATVACSFVSIWVSVKHLETVLIDEM